MAVIATKEIKKRRMLLTVFAALVATSGLVLYFGLFGGSTPPLPSEPSGDNASLPPADLQSEVPRLEVGILEDERFKNLQWPPGLPLATTTAGKANPFSD